MMWLLQNIGNIVANKFNSCTYFFTTWQNHHHQMGQLPDWRNVMLKKCEGITRNVASCKQIRLRIWYNFYYFFPTGSLKTLFCICNIIDINKNFESNLPQEILHNLQCTIYRKQSKLPLNMCYLHHIISGKTIYENVFVKSSMNQVLDIECTATINI